MTNKKQVVNKKVYTIELIEYSDGTTTMNRTNDGFGAMELLGYLEYIQVDIVNRFNKLQTPTRVKRKVISD